MAEHRQDTRSDADPNAMALDDAIDSITSRLRPVEGEETLDLSEAIGRVVLADVVAAVDVPSFRSSAMDGYAFRFKDLDDGNGVLELTGRSLAGHPGSDELTSGSCQRITTGARVADDADTVVQQENTTPLDDTHIRVDQKPERFEHVRDVGSDTQAGSLLLGADCLLGGADLAACAAHGVGHVTVRRKLRIGVLSTGDELVEATSSRGPGQIHDANRILLRSILARPGVELLDLGIVADTPEALQACAQAASGLDVLVSSGGVSVGDADHVRDVLGSEGNVELWKIAMKPGRPLAFGHLAGGQAWFGLPGNPVSAAITALKILEPALARLAGHTFRVPLSHRARLLQPLFKRPGRVEFQRGILTIAADGEWQVASIGAQDSHRLRSLQQANCLIELPVQSAGCHEGEQVMVTPMAELTTGLL